MEETDYDAAAYSAACKVTAACRSTEDVFRRFLSGYGLEMDLRIAGGIDGLTFHDEGLAEFEVRFRPRLQYAMAQPLAVASGRFRGENLPDGTKFRQGYFDLQKPGSWTPLASFYWYSGGVFRERGDGPEIDLFGELDARIDAALDGGMMTYTNTEETPA